MGYNITFVTVLFIILLMIASFSAGIWLADRFHKRAQAEQKAALEKQYLRLKSGSDADDPCRPYSYTPVHHTVLENIDLTPNDGLRDGWTDGGSNNDSPAPLGNDFSDRLKENGQATFKFRNPKQA